MCGVGWICALGVVREGRQIRSRWSEPKMLRWGGGGWRGRHRLSLRELGFRERLLRIPLFRLKAYQPSPRTMSVGGVLGGVGHETKTE